MLGVLGRKIAPTSSLVFGEPSTCSKINMNRFVFYLFRHCVSKLPFLGCFSGQAAVSLRMATQLSLAFLAHPVLSQLTFKALGSRSP